MSRRVKTPYAIRLPNPGKHLYPAPLSAISVERFRDLLCSRPSTGQKAQLYVHLPFCESICTFCAIFKYQLTSSTPVAEYLDALKAEIRAICNLPFIQDLRFDSVYFGGGTPSVIADGQIAELLTLIQSSFTLDTPQMTFEGHVGSLTREKMRFVRELGFTRLSTGIQTFDAGLRKALNLTPTEEEIHRCIETAREEGFADFNIDLMYNLPGQTAAIWERDLLTAVALDPSGVDVYDTVISRKTGLYAQVERRELRLEHDPWRLAENYRLAEDLLPAYGYHQKNLWAWDKSGYDNLLIARQGELRDGIRHIVGVGLSSYSLIDGQAFINEVNRRTYVESVQATGHGVKWHHQCSAREEMERFMIMSLQEFRLHREEFTSRFHRDFDEVFARQIGSFLHRGLIEPTAWGYQLTTLGRAWATTMTVEFYGCTSVEETMRARCNNTFFTSITHEEEFELPLFGVFHPELLLSEWSDFGPLVQYIRFLKRANLHWLPKFVRVLLGTIRRYGMPPLRWYVSALGAHLWRRVRRTRAATPVRGACQVQRRD